MFEKKRMMKGLAILVIMAVAATMTIISAAPPALAGHGHGLMRMLFGNEARPVMKRFMLDHMGSCMDLRDDLNITKEQWAELKTVLDNHRDALMPMVDELIAAKRELHGAVTAEGPNEDVIARASDRLGKAIGAMSVEASFMVAEARKILTPEQQEILKKHRQAGQKAVDELLVGLRDAR